MSALEKIGRAAQRIGYRSQAIVRDYAFADVFSSNDATRVAALAAFTQTPPSYRSAAMAVVAGTGRDAHDLVDDYRALGAPLLFLIEGSAVSVWQVRSVAAPRQLHRVDVSEIDALFETNRASWQPDAIHRAKSIGAYEREYQLDFVDVGLMPALEGELHKKLDQMLVEALSEAREAAGGRLDAHILFRAVFRLLAAKVLLDRGHPYATWPSDDLNAVLTGIQSYYSLDEVRVPRSASKTRAFQAVWNRLRRGISFCNISSDDLAFVYENTLVSPETRAALGTHSTPRQIAEYIVGRIGFHKLQRDALRVYEPFCGAGVFLVSALRHVRETLPIGWSDEQRHAFLVSHIFGDEFDAFAREVAVLSLILADYPNKNGWHIGNVDLFAGQNLMRRMREGDVVLCNPPFEAFRASDRAKHAAARQWPTKAVAALDAAIEAHPRALGFVLPRTFILESQFRPQRQKIEQLYGAVELVEVPDRAFGVSTIETALLIANDPRSRASTRLSLTSTEVSDGDRVAFLQTGQATNQRKVSREISAPPTGDLWVPALTELWDFLSEGPRLGDRFDAHLGARWTYRQEQAVSARKAAGYRLGLFNADDLNQFFVSNVRYLDMRPEHLTHAVEREWGQPKVILNGVRRSRGRWRIAAAPDYKGLVFSQQLIGLWPKDSVEDLEAVAAVLNGPIANAFASTHMPQHRFRLATLAALPLPRKSIAASVRDLINDYRALVAEPRSDEAASRANQLLFAIDAAVLEAYDLPPLAEQQLLDFLSDLDRPVQHKWRHWNDIVPGPGLRLSERLALPQQQLSAGWISDVFSPLPDEEALLLREYGS